jgi:biotin carboxyl carrier protein
MTQATVNQKTTFELEQKEGKTFLNGEIFEWDIRPISENHFHIITKDNQSINAEVVDINLETKTFQLKINGALQTVQLKDETDLLLERMGINTALSTKMKELKSPMPGLIYDLKVAIGDTVEKGDVLLILVAMKMENSIKAAGEGKVKDIKVNLNDSVEKGQVLITFE